MTEETITFYNQFGSYTVPASVYVDPTPYMNGPVPGYEVAGMIATINVDNAMGYQDYRAAYANWVTIAQAPRPNPPKYWAFSFSQFAAYWAALTNNGSGFNPNVSLAAYGLPGGVGGSFVPATA